MSKKKKVSNNKKRLIISLNITAVVLLITFLLFYKRLTIMGVYENTETNQILTIDLFEWKLEQNEGKKCDLWNCNYEIGTFYQINNNEIKFYFDEHRSISYNYEIKKDNNEKYLILSDALSLSKNVKKDTYKKLK